VTRGRATSCHGIDTIRKGKRRLNPAMFGSVTTRGDMGRRVNRVNVATSAGSVEDVSKVITVAGCLDEYEAEVVHRLVERALMKAGREMTVDLSQLTGFTPGGIAELSRAVSTGCRLPCGMRLLARTRQGRAVIIALCRWRAEASPRKELSRLTP
jgi:hypothetical protein